MNLLCKLFGHKTFSVIDHKNLEKYNMCQRCKSKYNVTKYEGCFPDVKEVKKNQTVKFMIKDELKDIWNLQTMSMSSGYQPRPIENENGKPPMQFPEELEKEDPKFFVKEHLPYDIAVRLQKLNDMLDEVL